MKTKEPPITVLIAQTPEEVSQALAFCGSVYERNYGTHWTTPPDLFFIAKEREQIVATGGLTFASRHAEIASERYFRLTDTMRHFTDTHRDRIVEFGRFASIKVRAAKAILHSTLFYAATTGIDFIFAWANPTVSKYTSTRLGLDLWPIAVPLNVDNAISDTRWASPPIGFFVRKRPPLLHLVVVPFCENVTRALAEDCGLAAAPAWQTRTPAPIYATAMKPTSFVLSAPRLLRGRANGSDSQPAKPALPELEPGLRVDTAPSKRQPKAD